MRGAAPALLGVPWKPIVSASAQFDGVNDYMTRGAGLTGAADSKSGILSTWVRLDGGDGSPALLLCSTTTLAGSAVVFQFRRNIANKFEILGPNAASATILNLLTVASYTASATWLHVLFSWDLATAGASNLYINDVSDKSAPTFTNDTIDYTSADWGIGGRPDAAGLLNGLLAECYFAPGQYLDFSVTANRRKFITATLRPMDLGSDGSVPTGTAPKVYQKLVIGETVSNFATNRGGGGNFSITGALTAGSTNPGGP